MVLFFHFLPVLSHATWDVHDQKDVALHIGTGSGVSKELGVSKDFLGQCFRSNLGLHTLYVRQKSDAV
jgi:hypothetical protein